jgi:hypothetical protein
VPASHRRLRRQPADKVQTRLSFSFASEPLLPGTATVGDGALARVDGSDLLPLRLRCLDKPATRFVASPTLRKVSRLAVRGLPGNSGRFVAPAGAFFGRVRSLAVVPSVPVLALGANWLPASRRYSPRQAESSAS